MMMERNLPEDTTIDRRGIETYSRKFQGLLQLLFTHLSLTSDYLNKAVEVVCQSYTSALIDQSR
jgi:hypothetical protein